MLRLSNAEAKTESVATEAKPTPDMTPVEGGPRPGQRAKWRENFVSRLLQWLRLDRLLVVPEKTSHSDCSRNDDCASK